MIRPLRRVHRAVFSVLLLALPLSLAWTLSQRPEVPAPVAEPRIERLQIDALPAPDGRLRLRIARPASLPEVLVYLDDDAAATEPGSAARLLGSLQGAVSEFAVTGSARGQVLLYSPALQQTLLRRPLP